MRTAQTERKRPGAPTWRAAPDWWTRPARLSWRRRRRGAAPVGEREAMVEGLAPGDWVRNPLAPEWGLGQVQSVIGERVTANFENAGKRLINAAVVSLTRVEPPSPRHEDSY